MQIFKEAIKQKVRFKTTRGVLLPEDLYDLKRPSLAAIARNLGKQLKREEDDNLSFLEETLSEADRLLELKLAIVKAIYLDKKGEEELLNTEADDKRHNAKIDALIAQKQEDDLKNMSIEELQALRR